MINPEFHPVISPESEIFSNLVEKSSDSARRSEAFARRLFIAMDKITYTQAKGIQLMTFLPNLDIANDCVQTDKVPGGYPFVHIAQSRLKRFDVNADLIIYRYLDKNRIGEKIGRECEPYQQTSDKTLRSVETTLPLVNDGKIFDYLKEEFFVEDLRKHEERSLNVNYTSIAAV